MISHVLKACQTLLLSTQYSIKCCKAFAASSASSILLDLIRSCNRSTPHQELLKYVTDFAVNTVINIYLHPRYALAILLNVAKHPDLASAVARGDMATDTVIDLMQTFRDKKSIFCHACELLSRLVLADTAVKVFINLNKHYLFIYGILNIYLDGV